MSSTSNSDFSDEFSEDEFSEDELDKEFLEKYRQIRFEEMKKNNEEQKQIVYPKLVKGKITNDVFNNYAKKIGDDMYIVDNYLSRGHELNAQLRRDNKIIEKIWKRVFVPLEQLTNVDYIKVCRMMSKPYDENLIGGFISTSNNCLRGFGEYEHIIYIPTDTKVMLIDLHRHVKRDDIIKFINNDENIYEIVLLPDTNLLYITGNKYVVNTVKYNEKEEAFDNLIEKDN